MAVDIVLTKKTASEVIQIVHDLRDAGLVSGKDFDFEFRPAQYDGQLNRIGDSVKFTFYDDEQGMIYSLKWS